MLWDEAVLIHFTVKKPRSNPDEHCHEDCAEWEVLEVCFPPPMYITVSPGINYLYLRIVVRPILSRDAGLLWLGQRAAGLSVKLGKGDRFFSRVQAARSRRAFFVGIFLTWLVFFSLLIGLVLVRVFSNSFFFSIAGCPVYKCIFSFLFFVWLYM